VSYLEALGFTVVRGAALTSVDGYLSGSDEERAADLHHMFENDDVHAIFCTRGGYGSGRLLRLLDYDLIRRHPKIFVGYSDITALSMAMLRHAGLVTFAGPMVAADMQAGMPRMTEVWLWDMLMGRHESVTIHSEAETQTLPSSMSGTGQLVGGTLSILATLIGTPYEPVWDGAVLFIEDVGENVYKVDRLLQHLTHACVLDRLSGVVLGAFTGIPDDEPNRSITAVFREYLEPLNIPVLDGFPFGHVPVKRTLPYGVPVTMDTAKLSLTIKHPAVA
jgi:muramoyltetrapeptide carboxypeptidase